MTEYKLIIGSPQSPLFVFQNQNTVDMSSIFSVDVAGNELSIDEMKFNVYFDRGGRELFVPKASGGLRTSDGNAFLTHKSTADLRKVAYGTTVLFYTGSRLLARGFLSSVARTGKYAYQIKAVSQVGILAQQQHMGGVYSGETFEEVCNDIIGSAFSVTIAPEVAEQGVFGWLPIATRRQNLHQLLFAMGATLTKDSSGNMTIGFLRDTVSGAIPDDRIYYGGSVNYGSPATAVEVTEHAYQSMNSTAEETLFSNVLTGDVAASTVVTFSQAPVHSLRADGLTIEESGANYAVVSGVGTLYGKPYVHITRTVIKATAATGSESNVARVQNATLVNQFNSENVAARCAAYYGSESTVSADIVLEMEKVGDAYSLNNAFGEATQAFLTRMEVIPSGIVKARCQLVEGYVPTGQGNNYTSYQTLTGSGTFLVPAELQSDPDATIRVTLIGGGHGGYSGADGQSASDGWNTRTSYELGTPGVGGEGGRRGDGGKIFTVVIPVYGVASFAFSCGAGGLSDEEGGATTFGSYTSDHGATSSAGYQDILTGDIYGAPGEEDGLAGGKGDASGVVTYRGTTWVQGPKGADASEWWGGREAKGFGGYGGGPAVGSNGGPGGDGEAGYEPPEDPDDTGFHYAIAGVGGDGANGQAGDGASVYGCGGNGGHGAGGGGIANYAYNNIEPGEGYKSTNPGGKGGKGGAGGKGCDGIIVVIY